MLSQVRFSLGPAGRAYQQLLRVTAARITDLLTEQGPTTLADIQRALSIPLDLLSEAAASLRDQRVVTWHGEFFPLTVIALTK